MNFEDYFDYDEGEYPFESTFEINECYIRWHDMFVAGCLETIKGADIESIRGQIFKAKEILIQRGKNTVNDLSESGKNFSVLDVRDRFKLSDFEFFCLLIAYAQEIDGRYEGGYKIITDDDTLSTPNVFYAKRLYTLVYEDDTGGLMLENKAVFNIFRSPKGKGALFDAFEANRQLVKLLNGNESPGDETGIIISEAKGTSDKDVFFYKEEIKEVKGYLESVRGLSGIVVNISGAESLGRIELIQGCIGDKSRAIILDTGCLEIYGKEKAIELFSETIIRCHLRKEELIVVADNKETGFLKLFLLQALKYLERAFVVSTESLRRDRTFDDFKMISLSVGLPSAYEQEMIWKNELSRHDLEKEVKPEIFSKKYRLGYKTIKRCVEIADANTKALGKKKISIDDITKAVLESTTSELDKLSDRVPLKFTFDDLVIDDSQLKIMKTLVSRVRNRSLIDEKWGFNDKVAYGKGVSLILYGPPGTGKTMAAQVMAREIGMALYRVDLSQLVDKYVGETEKNIGRIFDAAADGNVVLFFDEADALFSKRTEVSSSNDKHANTEVAYLLQKIEQHDGVTLLATNRYSDFDSAFIRRITYAVRMDKPDAEKRLRLFEKILPDNTPREKDLNLKYFADSFDLSGSEIKEVLYSAAFIAASDGESLSNRHLSQAIRYQQEKAGNVLQGAVFARYLN